MTFSDRKIHDIPFEEYLALAGYSYSGIKNDGVDFTPTAKMQLGTDVHNYLLTPEVYQHENIRIVKPLAIALKEKLGALHKFLLPERAVTCNFHSEGFTMPYKGRVDLGIPKRIIIDIKVTEMDIYKFVQYFGTGFQLSGYALGFEASLALIVSINPKTLKTKITNIPITSDWWQNQVIQKGTVIQ